MSITATEIRFDLRSLVLNTIESEGFENPQTTAEQLVGEIPGEVLREVLRELLPEYVRQVVKTQRHDTLNGKSKKKRHAENILSIHIALGPNEWKMLGDCTVEDVLILVRQHEDIAKFNLAEAEAYKRLAQQMTSKKVSIVRELGADAVQAALDD